MKTTFSIILFLVACLPALAQDTVTHKSPQAVLVQLNSEQNRIRSLTAGKKYMALEEVQNDAEQVMAATISDFKDNFKYCPVYYYIDTNAELVRQKKFDGILLDTGGVPVKIAPPKNYLIAWYGYPVSQSRLEHTVSDSTKYNYDPQSRSVKGLVVANDKFQQVTYFYKLGYDDLFAKKKGRKYYYSSKHYDIEYTPSAKTFNEKLVEHRSGRRVKG